MSDKSRDFEQELERLLLEQELAEKNEKDVAELTMLGYQDTHGDGAYHDGYQDNHYDGYYNDAIYKDFHGDGYYTDGYQDNHADGIYSDNSTP